MASGGDATVILTVSKQMGELFKYLDKLASKMRYAENSMEFQLITFLSPLGLRYHSV